MMKRKAVIIPIPDHDFCPTEVSIPWRALRNHGYEIVFSTEKGNAGEADPLLLKGVILGQLGANADAINAYRQLERSHEFRNPIRYSDINVRDFCTIYLPGGHASGMKQYLESNALQAQVASFFKAEKIIAAICHGPVVLARTIHPETNQSVLYGRKVTALPKLLERIAYFLTGWKLGNYYRTYPEYVQDEVTSVLHSHNDFIQGGSAIKPFTLVDHNLISARWPRDVYLFTDTLLQKIGSV
jgi:putative intracellular protease/amidase